MGIRGRQWTLPRTEYKFYQGKIKTLTLIEPEDRLATEAMV